MIDMVSLMRCIHPLILDVIICHNISQGPVRHGQTRSPDLQGISETLNPDRIFLRSTIGPDLEWKSILSTGNTIVSERPYVTGVST